ncbi:MAG: hypothetical protein QMD21_02265 [Candidatus Thermoplasmatota archaeon]|nr:hypothetical protein [Candidatus Thermoplasmatota archaeon]
MAITTTREINKVLYEKLKTEKSVKVSNLDRQDCIAVNIAKDVRITVDGRAGDFFGAYNKGSTLILRGDAGKELGYKMSSGTIVVLGDVESIGEFKGGNILVAGELKRKAKIELDSLSEDDKAQVAGFIEKELLEKLKKARYLEIEKKKIKRDKPIPHNLESLLLIKEPSESKEVSLSFELNNLKFTTPIFLAPQTPNLGFAYAGCLANSFSICKSNEEIEIVKSNNGTVITEWPEIENLDSSDATVAYYENPKELELLKEITSHECPIIAKVATRNIYECTKQALANKPEAIAIDCSYFPVLGAIPPALKAISEARASSKLLVLANLRNAEDILKVIALGADGVGLILEDKPGDWKIVGQVVSNMMKKLAEELKALLVTTGASSLEELSPENLRALTYDTAAITGVKLLGYERVLPLWEY